MSSNRGFNSGISRDASLFTRSRPSGASGHEQPTRVRYGVIGVCCLMSVLLYLDRFCVSFAEIYITEDLRLSESDSSLMFSAFFFSYALAQTPSGWLADRFGGRRMLTLFILGWSLFTGLLGLATGVVLLAVLRAGMGLAQAGAYPTAASIISKWIPLTQRGTASSIVALGGRIGGALSLFITGYVILLFVPISVQSKFVEQDLLRADRLCHELTTGAEKESTGKLCQRILAVFPTETRSQITEVATRYLQLQQNSELVPVPWYRKLLGNSEPTPRPFPDIAPATLKTELVAGLNQVLDSPDSFALDEPKQIKLETEAVVLLRRERLSLTRPEVERMNRLVLEGLFPKEIKKVYGAGWRTMTVVYGAIGIPVALLFWLICRDHPRTHPQCNAAELALIEANRSPLESTAKVDKLPLRELATNLSMCFNGAMQFFTNVGWVFLVTYLPRYLVEVHQVPLADRAWMSMTPTLVAIVGMSLGGFLTDRMTAIIGPRWGRSLPIALTRFAAAVAYLLCLLNITNPWVAVGLLSAAAFFCDLGIPAVWAFQQDVGGKHTGSVLGWGNMWGNFGATVGPPLIGWVAGSGKDQSWNAVFVVCAVAFVMSGLVALGVNATQKVVPEDSSH